MYQKILVGINSSERSFNALKVGLVLALAENAELHVLHVLKLGYSFPIMTMPAMGPQPILLLTHQQESANFVKIAEYEGQLLLARARKILGNALEEGVVRYHLESSNSPEKYFIDFAKKYDIDLIILGCKGHHSRLRRALLGTFASKVVNETPCQVLIAR